MAEKEAELPTGAVFQTGLTAQLESNQLHIEGPDRVSTLYIRNVADEIHNVLDRYFASNGNQFRAPRARVLLVSPFESGFSDPWELTRQEGHWTLRIRWSEQTRRDDVEEALTRLLLQRLASGVTNTEGLAPDWLVRAMVLRVTTHFAPAIRDEFARLAMVSSPPSLKSLFEASENNRIFNAQLYFLLLHLRQSLPQSIDRGSLFLPLLQGQDPGSVLPRKLRNFEDLTEANWIWVTEYYRLARERRGPIWDLDESARQVFLLIRFDLQSADGEMQYRVTLEDIWDWRNEPNVRAELERRVNRIRTLFPRINPVYFNSLQMAGELFESIDELQSRGEFMATLADFAREWDYAQQLHREIRVSLVEAY